MQSMTPHRFILALFATTLLVSAALLFWVQPLVAKMILPYFGGAPAVWNTAMMFFQGMLLMGYLYAHGLTRWVPWRIQAFLHPLLLTSGLLVLPFAISTTWQASDYHPISSLLLLLIVLVGLPLFALSANASLLQRWFSQTPHPSAKDPYFLYSASNLGSMLALLGFPFLFEPLFTLSHQSYLWTVSFALLCGLILCCASLTWITQKTIIKKPQQPLESQLPPTDIAPTPWQRAQWVLLAFAPSSLLLGVTTYLTTDIAAVPLFWVIPLALYLLSFIIVFARKPIFSSAFNRKVQFVLLIPFFFIISFPYNFNFLWATFIIHLGVFFFTALVCHGELVRSRPHYRYLTEFYLWIAFGGWCGGIFNAIIAPALFTQIAEYPLALTLALMLRPAYDLATSQAKVKPLDLILPLFMGVFLFVLSRALEIGAIGAIPLPLVLVFTLFGVVAFSFPERPIRFGLCIGVLILSAIYFINPYQSHVINRSRNFFGTIRVVRDDKNAVHLLLSGTTIHGVQMMKPKLQTSIRSYYQPLQNVFQVIYQRYPQATVAIGGLGSGTLACYARKQDKFTFYEIDPTMIQIAKNPRYFTFLQHCPVKGGIIIGDARIKMRKAPPKSYDMIILDAFSSDAIPVHLITLEAITMYLQKLKPKGLLVFNITNRHLNLIPVLANIASQLRLQGKLRIDKKTDWSRFTFQSAWVVLAREKQDFGLLNQNPQWESLPASTHGRVWTDNYSDILSVIRW